jgi:hypothetical protein
MTSNRLLAFCLYYRYFVSTTILIEYIYMRIVSLNEVRILRIFPRGVVRAEIWASDPTLKSVYERSLKTRREI